MFAIKNGKSGDLAAVDSTGRLHIHSVTESEAQHASELGDSYILHTDIIELTTNVTSAVFYFKNNEQQDMIINTTAFTVGIEATRIESPIVSASKNVTGGTIIDDAVPMPVVQNINFSSPKFIDSSLAFIGGDGKTATGGVHLGESFVAAGVGGLNQTNGTLSKGSSLVLFFNPNSTGGTTRISITISAFLKNEPFKG